MVPQRMLFCKADKMELGHVQSAQAGVTVPSGPENTLPSYFGSEATEIGREHS